jgi:hypothetical protein
MRFACPWEEIDRFQNLVEFRSFERWMTGQVSSGMAKQVPVADPYAAQTHIEIVEVWYMHVMSHEVWRLVWPEPPHDGLFMRVRVVSPADR